MKSCSAEAPAEGERPGGQTAGGQTAGWADRRWAGQRQMLQMAREDLGLDSGL